MLHKCANPNCLISFRKLSEGKLFLLETNPVEGSDSRRANWKRVEYYWLCQACAVALTLFFEKGRGIVTVARNTARKSPEPALRPSDLLPPETGRSGQAA
jgi:hypothetical protein